MNPKTKEKVQIDNSKLFAPDAKENLIKEFLEFANKADASKVEENKAE